MQTLTPFFSAWPMIRLSPATQFLKPSSRVISPLLGSSGSLYLYPVKPITLGQPKSAQASITFVYRSTSSSWYLGLLKPVLNGAPGIVFDAIAQVSPCFLSVGKSSGATISTDGTPKPVATSHVWSSDHLSPADMKHQATSDCLMLPFMTAFPGVSADASPAAARAPAASASRRVNWFGMASPAEGLPQRHRADKPRAGTSL